MTQPQNIFQTSSVSQGFQRAENGSSMGAQKQGGLVLLALGTYLSRLSKGGSGNSVSYGMFPGISWVDVQHTRQ